MLGFGAKFLFPEGRKLIEDNMVLKKVTFIFLLQIYFILLFSPLVVYGEDPPERPWSVMLYSGFGTTSDLGQVLTFNIDSEDSQFLGVVLNHEIFSFWRYFNFELEGQVLRHFGKQDNWEFNGLFLVRFNPFPWDKYLDTSFAVGEGLSYATSTPKIEVEQHSNQTSRFLNYLLLELAFQLPKYPEWALASRIHHRSGIYGTFNGVDGASNFLGLGLRYHF